MGTWTEEMHGAALDTFKLNISTGGRGVVPRELSLTPARRSERGKNTSQRSREVEHDQEQNKSLKAEVAALQVALSSAPDAARIREESRSELDLLKKKLSKCQSDLATAQKKKPSGARAGMSPAQKGKLTKAQNGVTLLEAEVVQLTDRLSEQVALDLRCFPVDLVRICTHSLVLLLQATATTLLKDRLAESERQLRDLRSSVEGVDLVQAKHWRQEELQLQSQVKALQGRLDDRPSDLDIMEKVANMMTKASADSLSGALPFVQALTSTGTLAPAHVAIGHNNQNPGSNGNSTSRSNSHSNSAIASNPGSENISPNVRMQQVERSLSLTPAPNAGLVPRIKAAEVCLFGPEGGTGGSALTRLTALESELTGN
jgi:hypothetical protein